MPSVLVDRERLGISYMQWNSLGGTGRKDSLPSRSMFMFFEGTWSQERIWLMRSGIAGRYLDTVTKELGIRGETRNRKKVR